MQPPDPEGFQAQQPLHAYEKQYKASNICTAFVFPKDTDDLQDASGKSQSLSLFQAN